MVDNRLFILNIGESMSSSHRISISTTGISNPKLVYQNRFVSNIGHPHSFDFQYLCTTVFSKTIMVDHNNTFIPSIWVIHDVLAQYQWSTIFHKHTTADHNFFNPYICLPKTLHTKYRRPSSYTPNVGVPRSFYAQHWSTTVLSYPI